MRIDTSETRDDLELMEDGEPTARRLQNSQVFNCQERLFEFQARRGDYEQDLPPSPLKARRLTEEEIRAEREEADAELHNRFETALADIQKGRRFFRTGLSFAKVLSIPFILAGLTLGILVISQILVGLQVALQMNQFVATVLVSIYGVMLLVSFAIAIQAIRQFLRLRTYALSAVQFEDELKSRRSLQEIAFKKRQEAREELKRYLREHPLLQPGASTRQAGLFREEELRKLREASCRLLDESGLDTDAWIKEFRERFQSKLDRKAEEIVGKFSIGVLTGTALSPVPALDRIIVFGTAVSLLKSLLEVYGLRPSVSRALVVLSASLTHTYISGYTQEAARSIYEDAGELLTKTLGDAVGKTTQIVGSKAGEGAINYILMRRIGSRAMLTLAPTKPTTKRVLPC